MGEIIEVTPGSSLPLLKYFDYDIYPKGDGVDIIVHLERETYYMSKYFQDLVEPIKIKQHVSLLKNKPNYFTLELTKKARRKEKKIRKSLVIIWLLVAFFTGLFYYFIAIAPIETVPTSCNTTISQTSISNCTNVSSKPEPRSITLKDVGIVLAIPTGVILFLALNIGSHGITTDTNIYQLVRRLERDTSYDEA